MQEHEIVVAAGFPRAAELCLMQVEQGLPDHKCGHLLKDLGLQSSAAGSNWRMCGERTWRNCGKKECRSQGAGRGCTLGKLGCGGLMCLSLNQCIWKCSWAPGFWRAAPTNCECLVWLWMVIKMQRGSCLLDLPCQTSPEYLCALEINDLFNLGIPDWPHVSLALSKVFFVLCRCRNL